MRAAKSGLNKILMEQTMSSELLLEILCQDIPALMQTRAIDEMTTALKKDLEKNSITHSTIEGYITHRRIIFIIQGLPKIIEGTTKEIKGPKIDSPDQALQGFLRTNKCTKDDLIIKNNGKFDAYYINVKTEDLNVKEILSDILLNSIFSYVWPKSMILTTYNLKWVRPINNILCIFDGEILPIKSIPTNNQTTGHRFKYREFFAVQSSNEYLENITARSVFYDHRMRKESIIRLIEKIQQKEALTVYSDSKLFNYKKTN